MLKDVLFKVAMFFRLYDSEEGTVFFDNGYHQAIADIRNGKLTVYAAPVRCELHDQPLVCLRCVQGMQPLAIVPAEPPKRPCLEYFDNVNRIVRSDTESLPPLGIQEMEELLARHREAS